LWAYQYDGTSLTNIAHTDVVGHVYDVAVSLDGTIFLANWRDGLWAYSFNGSSFVNTAYINDSTSAKALEVGSDGTVFLANFDNGGLSAYSYNGNSFTRTAHIDDGGVACDVAVGPDGSVFLANGSEGLFAYTYSDYVGIDDNYPSAPDNFSLLQNYPNPFNPITTIRYSLANNSHVKLIIYNTLGQIVDVLVNGFQSQGLHRVIWNTQNQPSGIYIYRLEANGFSAAKKMFLQK
jgi:hypothetical protein